MEKATTVDAKELEQLALQRLRAIKGMEFDAKDEIRKADQDIQTVREQMREQIKALERKKERTRQHKRDVRREHLPSALSAYTASWSKPLFEQMQQRLPREIRDIVYAYIWTDKTLKEAALQDFAKRGCFRRAKDCDMLVTTHHSAKTNSCYQHGRVPYFMRPGFVGDKSAREIVESWYKSISRVEPDVWVLVTIRELECIILGDAFSVGLDVTTVVRELTLKLLTDRVLENKDDETSESKRTINALLQIKNKANFKLTLRLEQLFLQFNCWPTIFDILRPMIETFEKEGAHVKLLLVYAQKLKPKMEFNMLPALKDPEYDWRGEAARYFDSDYRVRDHHKHYRIENDADYEPERLKDMYHSDDAWQSEDELDRVDWDYWNDSWDGVNDDGSTWSYVKEKPRSPSPSPERYFRTVFRPEQIEGWSELESEGEEDDSEGEEDDSEGEEDDSESEEDEYFY